LTNVRYFCELNSNCMKRSRFRQG